MKILILSFISCFNLLFSQIPVMTINSDSIASDLIKENIVIESEPVKDNIYHARLLTYDDSLQYLIRYKGREKFVNNAFSVGEILDFEVYLKILFSVTAGYTKMAVPDTVYYKGRPCYRILTMVRSTSFIANFYTLKDTIESYLDMEYGMTWYYSKRTREGGFNRDLFVHYDHVNEKAKINEIRYKDEEGKHVKSKKEYAVKIEPFTQDILSSFYYMRTKEIKTGSKIDIPVNSLRTNYDLKVRVKNSKKYSVDAGDFRAHEIEPKIKGENIINNTDEMEIFIAQASHHIPVKMRTELAIGSINVELYEYHGVKKD